MRKKRFRQRIRGRGAGQIKKQAVWRKEKTGFEVGRPGSRSTRPLLQIGLNSSPPLTKSQGFILELHFKANNFNQSSGFKLEQAAESLGELLKIQMAYFYP